MRLKVHERQGDVVVAVCDQGLVGREFDGEDSGFTVHESFYGDEEADGEEVREALVRATIVNVLGEEAVDCALEAGVLDEECVEEVEGIPHGQMVTLRS